MREDGKFKDISANVFYGFFDNKDIMKFRKDTHIFRHASNEALDEKISGVRTKSNFILD